jgi:hypothetical protein
MLLRLGVSWPPSKTLPQSVWTADVSERCTLSVWAHAVWTKNGVLFSEKNVRYTCALEGALAAGDLRHLLGCQVRVRGAHFVYVVARLLTDPSIRHPATAMNTQ